MRLGFDIHQHHQDLKHKVLHVGRRRGS
jgi:hypothetical protein